jgi:hypothetical protein
VPASTPKSPPRATRDGRDKIPCVDDSDDVELVVFARLYPNEAASKVQYENFAKFQKREDLDGVSAYRYQLQDGTYVVAVLDVSGRAQEFGWAGEPHELTQAIVDGLIARLDSFVGEERQKIHYHGPASRPRMMPDGTWVIPRLEG